MLHRQLVHASTRTINQVVHLFKDVYRQALKDCTVCPLAKHTRLPFKNSTTRADAIFDLIHIDGWGV